MAIGPDTLKQLIDLELESVCDTRVVTHVRGMLVEPYVVLRDWDYGAPGDQYPCWMVLCDLRSMQRLRVVNTASGHAALGA